MRRSLFALSVLAAACAATPLAAAEPADAAVQVRAVWGPEQFPIGEVAAEVAPCTGGAPATVTTGADGTATFHGGAGCYQVKVATPTGCSLDGDPTQQVTAVPGITPIATFRFRCA
ncbi:prealbumin-like fold domain-containing protein [Nocardia yamanashiensis]|uniref:prealbumin-like fold domain-containing protein n=1 Tax=Nocardia yamanashiensis TaxID=209247 RepID=UPI001E495647|nr:prealbumin-like fold domain-containing protein [Nocardia yamanashiensis]UGT39410.1 prealbumin-like fold domain-containing protein [Nocardia yamanashiensis]